MRLYIRIYYLYSFLNAGERLVIGGVVGPIISVTTIVVVITIAVALVIARKRKAKDCGTCDLKEAVSVDKYSVRTLVYCAVNVYAVWCWFIVSHKT